MRSFNVEYRAVAGFHDGVRQRIVGSADALVSAHESIHGRIFRETPDGQLHAAYCRAIEKGLLSGPTAEAVAASSLSFFEESELAQESFATYLSVKIFPASSEASLLQQLTPEYTRYFRLLSDVIDPHFTSSQLQFLVGWNAAAVVFSSPLLERFHSLDMSVPIRLIPDELPNPRFGTLLEILGRTRFEGLISNLEMVARAECTKRELPYWNIQSDAAWIEAAYSGGNSHLAVGEIEEALSWPLRDWLVSILPFPILHGSRLSAAFERYTESMQRNLNIRTRRWSEQNIAPSFDEHAFGGAVEESDSRIINPSPYRLRQHDPSLLHSDALFERASSIAIYSACPPERNLLYWSIFGWSKKEEVDPDAHPEFFAEFPRADVVSFLSTWLERKGKGIVVPHLRSIVLAIDGALQFGEALTGTDFLLWKHEELFDKLCWYWWGRFYDVYKIFGGRDKSLLTGCLHTDPAVENLISLNEKFNYNGLVLKIVHSGTQLGSGFFMRAFPMHSASPIMALERALIAEGSLKEMPSELLERFAPVAKEALQAAQWLWSEY